MRNPGGGLFKDVLYAFVLFCSFATLLFWLVQGKRIISKLFPRDPGSPSENCNGT